VFYYPSPIPPEIQRLSIFQLKADGYPVRLKLSRISPQLENFEVDFHKSYERRSDTSACIEDRIEINTNVIFPYTKAPLLTTRSSDDLS